MDLDRYELIKVGFIVVHSLRLPKLEEIARYYLGLYQLVASERTDMVWRREEERGHVDQEAN